MIGEHLIERVDNLRSAKLLRAINGGGEIPPEGAHHLFPVDLGIRDSVEIIFERGGEIIFHIALEEAGEERGYKPPLSSAWIFFFSMLMYSRSFSVVTVAA